MTFLRVSTICYGLFIFCFIAFLLFLTFDLTTEYSLQSAHMYETIESKKIFDENVCKTNILHAPENTRKDCDNVRHFLETNQVPNIMRNTFSAVAMRFIPETYEDGCKNWIHKLIIPSQSIIIIILLITIAIIMLSTGLLSRIYSDYHKTRIDIGKEGKED